MRRLEKLWATFRLGRALQLAFRAAPRLSLAYVVLLAAQGALPLAGLLAAQRAVDVIASGRGPTALGNALLWLGVATAVAALAAVLGSLSTFVSEALVQFVTDHVGDVIHRQSIALDLSFYEDPAFHDALHRAQQEAPYRPARIIQALAGLLRDAVSLAAMGALLGSLRWWLPSLLLLAAVPTVLVRLRFSNELFGWMRRTTQDERRYWYLHELLTSRFWAAEVRLFGLGGLFREGWSEARARLRSARLAISGRRSAGDGAAQVAAAAVTFGAFGFFAQQTLAGFISIGAFVAQFQAFQRGLVAFQGLLGALAELWEHNLFLSDLDDFLAVRPRVVESSSPQPFPNPVSKGIRFEAVTFRYRRDDSLSSPSRPALEGIDLEIRPGEILALVGPNGSGKSTLVKLLMRLYDPIEGRITVDGVDLRQFALEDLRRNVGTLLQDFGRYDFTARENIRLGDVTDPGDGSRIVNAARQAGALSEIENLPRGWETVLGASLEDGRDLSPGEWQRLALARALFRDAPILVLDEPSASLDPLAERDLFYRFHTLAAGRTAVFVSHRFSTVRAADRIAVLDQGRLVEQGSHEELLRARGLYARMWQGVRETLGSSRDQ